MPQHLDFFVIGAQRSGTTTLCDVLRQHPRLYLPAVKEVQYFTVEDFRQRGPRFLEPYYRDAGADRRRGLADVQLLAHADAPRLLRDHYPDARHVAILRDPAERAHSAYWFARNRGLDPAPTFEDALRRERAGDLGGEWERAHLTHLAHGRYATQLGRYVERFGADRVYVLLTDDLWDDARAAVGGLFRWLGVDDDPEGVRYQLRSNAAAGRRSRALQRLLDRDGWLKRAVRATVDDATRVRLRRHVLTRVDRLNRRPFEVPPMAPNTRAQLVAEYTDEIAELERLIERDLSAWLR